MRFETIVHPTTDAAVQYRHKTRAKFKSVAEKTSKAENMRGRLEYVAL